MESEFMKNIRENPFFNTLPAALQETIIQSGASVSNEQDLRNLAETYLKKKPAEKQKKRSSRIRYAARAPHLKAVKI